MKSKLNIKEQMARKNSLSMGKSHADYLKNPEISFYHKNRVYYYKSMPKNCTWRTICCKQSSKCICKERWEEWKIEYDRRIKTHHLYCICNTGNLLCFCPVKNHKNSNSHINKNIISLLKSEVFPLDIKENIIKKLNKNIWFEEHIKACERQKELDEIREFVGNEFY